MRMRAPRTDVTTRSLSRPHLTDDARWESRSPSFSSASSPRRRCAFSWYVNSRAHDKPRVGSHDARARVREVSNPATRRHSGSLPSRRPVRRARSFVRGATGTDRKVFYSFVYDAFVVDASSRAAWATDDGRSIAFGWIRSVLRWRSTDGCE